MTTNRELLLGNLNSASSESTATDAAGRAKASLLEEMTRVIADNFDTEYVESLGVEISSCMRFV